MSMLSIFRGTRRLISSSSALPEASKSTTASKQHVLYQVWGTSTDVGKTILSAGLLRAVNQSSLYVKPVQTGPPNAHDSILIDKVAKLAKSCTLVSYDTPVSADLASELTHTAPITDAAIEHGILGTIRRFEQHLLSAKLDGAGDTDNNAAAFGLLETAGGVLSPLPSGNLQADFYRKFRLPGVLVGDAKLGGISGTLAAYEALRLRGFDVPAIVLFPQHKAIYENERAIERGVDLDYTTILRAPDLPPSEVELYKYFERDEVDSFFRQLLEHLRCSQGDTAEKNALMTAKAKYILWYPFTQHKNLDTVTCIDSAHGDRYKVYDAERGGYEDIIDAFGSWWTTGVGHGDARVARAVAYAAGRYGHVGLPNAIHDGAYEVAKRMLEGVGKGWASRVFFSDNGSTAIEVALKMAFRKQLASSTSLNYANWNDMKIVGCVGSYHGDTLGAMDCSAKSDFNSKQTPWYTPRGLFFEPPTVAIMNGVWKLRIPEEIDEFGRNGQSFRKRDDIYDEERDGEIYEEYITKCMDSYGNDGNELGALLLEPVMMGAGGMTLVDPAFQRALVRIARQRGLVVVFDEVFSGLWRLGAKSGAEILGVKPDIACYAKLLTGGTLPLSVTLATDEVFQAFVSDDLRDALLHGHSYTGHAIGCSAAVESLKMYEEQLSSSARENGVVRYWDDSSVKELSCTPGVVSVSEMGTVLSLELEGESSGGYAATGSVAVQKRLLEQGVMTRPLGNVLYVMVPPLAEPETCKVLSDTLYRTILECSEEAASRIA